MHSSAAVIETADYIAMAIAEHRGVRRILDAFGKEERPVAGKVKCFEGRSHLGFEILS
jgi:hypothetical protein